MITKIITIAALLAFQSAQALTEVYGTASDGTPLTWEVYTPTGTGPWPAIINSHGGGFKREEQAGQKMLVTTNDLVAAGYIVFCDHVRLAPNGHITGQVGNGRYPQQHEDTTTAILAARSDSRTNGRVGGVGGSAGATHTLWACANGVIGQDRLDCGVSLSGAYDYADRTPDANLNAFVSQVANYCGSSDPIVQATMSPINHLALDMSPTFLANSTLDTMPKQQQTNLVAAFATAGITNSSNRQITGYYHAFAVWPFVKTDAIAFLDANLK